jgi:hypothetical protein
MLHNRHPERELATLSASPYPPAAPLATATRCRTGRARLRPGNVTAATVHAATVPVLVVPAGSAEPAEAAAAVHGGVTAP